MAISNRLSKLALIVIFSEYSLDAPPFAKLVIK